MSIWLDLVGSIRVQVIIGLCNSGVGLGLLVSVKIELPCFECQVGYGSGSLGQVFSVRVKIEVLVSGVRLGMVRVVQVGLVLSGLSL